MVAIKQVISYNYRLFTLLNHVALALSMGSVILTYGYFSPKETKVSLE